MRLRIRLKVKTEGFTRTSGKLASAGGKITRAMQTRVRVSARGLAAAQRRAAWVGSSYNRRHDDRRPGTMKRSIQSFTELTPHGARGGTYTYDRGAYFMEVGTKPYYPHYYWGVPMNKAHPGVHATHFFSDAIQPAWREFEARLAHDIWKAL